MREDHSKSQAQLSRNLAAPAVNACVNTRRDRLIFRSSRRTKMTSTHKEKRPRSRQDHGR
jgi:hypothetical protein